jgi:hypothetical protein
MKQFLDAGVTEICKYGKDTLMDSFTHPCEEIMVPRLFDRIWTLPWFA